MKINTHTSTMSSMSSPIKSPRSKKVAIRFFFLGVLAVAVGSTFWRLTKMELNHATHNEGQLLPVRKETKDEKQNVNVAADNEITGNGASSPRVWLVGIIRNAAAEIQPHILDYLITLNCQYNVSIHIVATEGVDEFKKTRNALVVANKKCAEFQVEKEPSSHLETDTNDNRIDRISIVRDYQRQVLQTMIQPSDAVIIADLDLYRLPDIGLLQAQVNAMLDPNYKFDAVCAAGIMYRPFGYYDIFATILLDRTFVYPLRGRLNQTIQQGENVSLIRSNDLYGNYTQWDMLEYFQHESTKLGETNLNSTSLSTPVPVQSCFGGLTLYKASSWLAPSCNYHVKDMNTTHLKRYATKTSERPCEHVVLHDCLKRSIGDDDKFQIAVQPSLQTEWNANLNFTNKLYPSNRHESLGVFRKHINQGDKLMNGKYILRINAKGDLVVERDDKKEGKSSNQTVVGIWKANPIKGTSRISYWTHAFLMLKPNGLLELVKQVSKSELERHGHYEICATNGTTTCECDAKSDHCKVVVWTTASHSSGFGAMKKEQNEFDIESSPYVLILREDGTMQVVDDKTNTVVWTNAKSNHKKGKTAEKK